MIAEALDIARETYFAILLDRAFDGPVMIGSPVGGMDIEEVCCQFDFFCNNSLKNF
jgi:succinyl-CoA synthetase beta subunit